MIKELYGRLQDKYSARMQGVSQMENTFDHMLDHYIQKPLKFEELFNIIES